MKEILLGALIGIGSGLIIAWAAQFPIDQLLTRLEDQAYNKIWNGE